MFVSNVIHRKYIKKEPITKNIYNLPTNEPSDYMNIFYHSLKRVIVKLRCLVKDK